MWHNVTQCDTMCTLSDVVHWFGTSAFCLLNPQIWVIHLAFRPDGVRKVQKASQVRHHKASNITRHHKALAWSSFFGGLYNMGTPSEWHWPGLNCLKPVFLESLSLLRQPKGKNLEHPCLRFLDISVAWKTTVHPHPQRLVCWTQNLLPVRHTKTGERLSQF